MSSHPDDDVVVSFPEEPASPGPGRMEQRREQRQRRRRTLGRAAALGLAVVVLAAAVGLVLTRRGGGHPGSAAVSAPRRTQQTLLFQLRAADGSAAASALLAHDPASSSGAGILLPPELIVPVPGSGSVSLGAALRSGQGQAGRNALSDLFGVTVDGGWVLDLPTFARLVDGLGGVDVDVDVPVLGGPAGDTVVVSPGQQHLDGAQAVAVATWLAQGEQEQSRLARLQQVLDGVLAALAGPTLTGQAGSTATSAEAVRTVALRRLDNLIIGLGPGSVASVSNAYLAAFLTGLQADRVAHDLEFDSLPVVAIDLGAGAVSFRVDGPAVRQLVDRLLAQSVPVGARTTGNRVLVLNGVGTPGLGARARARLVPAGFVYVGSRNATRFGYPHTVVLVHDDTVQGQALGARVCRALNVAVNVQVADLGNLADVVVIVGADFTG